MKIKKHGSEWDTELVLVPFDCKTVIPRQKCQNLIYSSFFKITRGISCKFDKSSQTIMAGHFLIRINTKFTSFIKIHNGALKMMWNDYLALIWHLWGNFGCNEWIYYLEIYYFEYRDSPTTMKDLLEILLTQYLTQKV